VAEVKNDRNNIFQHLVLAGLWVLILRAFGKVAIDQAINFKINAIAFGDMFGLRGDEAKQYRRENTYRGDLP
jgi:hypothetical protein